VRVKVFNCQGQLVGPVESARVVKTDAEWLDQLTPEQYQVTRGKGTEWPCCGTLLDNKRARRTWPAWPILQRKGSRRR